MSERSRSVAASDVDWSDAEAWLCGHIGNWIDQEIGAGNQVPDFWDENETSERLAKYLIGLGYRITGA
jgi:hypothetical protein